MRSFFIRFTAWIFISIALVALLFSEVPGSLLQRAGLPRMSQKLAVHEAQAAITRVQSKTCSNNGATTIVCTLTSTPTNGNTLIAVVGTRSSNGTSVSSITQTGVTWSKAVGVSNGSNNTTDIWVSSNASGASTAITINLTSSMKASAIIAEYTEISSTPVDITASTTGNSNTASSGTIFTTSQADELWISGMTVGNAGVTFSAQTNSFTEVGESASTGGRANTRNNSVFEEKIVSAVGTAQVSATMTSSAQWSGAIAAFKRRGALSVGVTSGTMIAAVDSGGTSQFAQDSTCNAPTSCAAFTLDLSGGGETLNSIKITKTGTASVSDLSNVALFYDTDGNYSNGTTGQFGSTVASFTGSAVTISGSLAVTAGPTYYFYVRYNVKSSTPTYPAGGQTIGFQIASNADVVFASAIVPSGAPVSLSGTSVVQPNATSTTFGSGLADGGRSGESITISGFGFGVAPGGSRANCGGGVNTGCIQFLTGGTDTVADASVTAWSNTSITFTISTTLATYGGASGLSVLSGSQDDNTPLTFYIYPNITGMTTCAASGARDNVCGTNAAMEYSASDTFGLIQLNGDHFKSTAGTAQFTGAFGALAGTVHATAEGACSVGGWADTSVCLEVASSISDTVQDGTITMTRNGDSKTATISLHIVPRIASVSPTAGVAGTVVTIDGNHFCQTGTCPGSPPTSDYKVYFGATQAISSDFVATGNCSAQAASWSNTRICVKVPTGVGTGSQNIKVVGKASPLYESQRSNFSIQSTVPNTPDVGPGASKGQFKSDATTAINVSGYTNQSTVVLRADITAVLTIDMALQIEVQPVGSAFACGSGACGTAVEGTVGGGGACNSCTTLAGARVTVSGLTDGSKHWQARVRNTTTNEYSAWVSFGGNAESAADFIVDTVAPTVTFGGANTCTDAISGLSGNSVTVGWSTNESATGQVEYGTDSGLSGSTLYPSSPATSAVSQSVTLSNVNSNTTYYFRVKAQDAAGNLAQRPTISPFCSFTTSAVTQPGKTVSFFIAGDTSTVTNNGDLGANFYFSVLLPETAVSLKNSFVEITGISEGGGTNLIQVQVNNQSKNSYDLNASSKTHFKILYPVDLGLLNVNDQSPCTFGNPSGTAPCNQLNIIPTAGLDVNITSAKIITTYGFTP